MFSKDQLLDLAYAIKFSMPECNKKTKIMTTIDEYLQVHGNEEEKFAMETLSGIPDRADEDCQKDLVKDKELCYHESHGEYDLIEVSLLNNLILSFKN